MTSPTTDFKTLIPVHGTHGCVGHLIRTAKGFKTYDAADRLVGVYDTANLAVAAILATEVAE